MSPLEPPPHPSLELLSPKHHPHYSPLHSVRTQFIHHTLLALQNLHTTDPIQYHDLKDIFIRKPPISSFTLSFKSDGVALLF